jgi:helix-turn-helix, Psq domain./Tc5 transposase DNA-binding domain.
MVYLLCFILRLKMAKVKNKSKAREITPKPKSLKSRKGCAKLKYPEESMNLALEAMAAGLSAKSAARQYGVPRTTLTDKFKGKTPPGRRMGPSPVLTDTEELQIVQWLLNMNSAGFPVTKNILVETVSKLIIQLGRQNSFKDNVPGRSWFKSFMKRHPNLSQRTPQNLTKSRGNVSKESLINWSQEIDKFLEEHSLKEVISQPDRVFNADEAAFFFVPKREQSFESQRVQECVFTSEQ